MVALSISGPPRYGRLGRMRRATKRRVQLFLRLLLVGTLIGVAYGSLIGLTFRGTALINSLIGAIDGATITAVIAAVEIFLLRTRWGRPLQQAPFLVTFGVKWLVYGVVIAGVMWYWAYALGVTFACGKPASECG